MGKPIARTLSKCLIFLPSEEFFVGDGVLLPLFSFTFSFPLFPFFISMTPITQEITQAKNNDGRVKGVIEVTIASRAEIEEEQLHFIHVKVTKVCYNDPCQFFQLISIRLFFQPKEKASVYYFRNKPRFGCPSSIT